MLRGISIGDEEAAMEALTLAPLLGTEMSIKSPRDSASGQATGKRQHMPLRLTGYYV
jgi:hypothetical protein